MGHIDAHSLFIHPSLASLRILNKIRREVFVG
jgi:hypothetical protein